MKKLLLISAIVVICVMAFYGCASKPEEQNDEPTTRVVTTIHGKEVEIPANPERIVALTGAADLVALGVRPVASMNFYNEGEFTEVFEGIAMLENTRPFDVEEIMTYEPDLILVYSGLSTENVELLENLAPVVQLLDQELNQRVRLEHIGEILGLEAEVDEIMDDYAAHLTQAKQTLTDAGIYDKTVNVFMYSQGTMMVFLKYIYYFNYVIYHELELSAPQSYIEDIEEQTEFSKNLSMESLPDYSGDYIFILSYVGTDIPSDLEQNALWSNLDAVKDGNYGGLPRMLYANNGITYAKSQIDMVVNMLLEAFDE